MKKISRKWTKRIALLLIMSLLLISVPITAVSDEQLSTTASGADGIESIGVDELTMVDTVAFDREADEITPNPDYAPNDALYSINATPAPSDAPIASGVYSITTGNYSLDMKDGGTTSGTSLQLWSTYSTTNRNQLFKITYLKTYDGLYYYSIRPMTNSGLGLSAPAEEGQGGYLTAETIIPEENFNFIPWEQCWAIAEVDGGYTIRNGHSTVGGGYLCHVTPLSNGRPVVIFPTDVISGMIKWDITPFTEETFDSVTMRTSVSSLTIGQAFQFDAYMYSSEIGNNGPISYRVADDDYSATDRAIINSTTGELTSLGSGKIKVGATYTGAPWIWWWNVEIIMEEEVYFFRNIASLKYMRVEEEEPSDYTVQSKFERAEIQKWDIIKDDASGYYFIRNDETFLALTTPDIENENKLITLEFVSSSLFERQLWRFICVGKDDEGNNIFQIQAKVREGTDLVLAISAGLESSNLKIQQRISGSVATGRDQWYVDTIDTHVYKTLPVRILYDIDCIYSNNDLTTYVNNATEEIVKNFNIKFNVEIVERSTRFDLSTECLAETMDAICPETCALNEMCNYSHHRSAGRMIDLETTNYYTIRVVGYGLCYNDFGDHGGVYGLAKVGGRDSIVTTMSPHFKRTIQHELTHNLGADHCDSADNCIFANWLDKWCINCRNAIYDHMY